MLRARTDWASTGKTVILTFGLLSRDKGIEHVIDALPAILAVHPDTVYIVLGATHPHVVEHEGEAYRLMLEARGQQLGVAGSMIFHNRFVSQDELTEFLSATDIYITPYLQPEQITSGTLAYAVGAGKAVISTPYIYARELLAEGRGVLVPWRDSPRDRAGSHRPGQRPRQAASHVRAGGRVRRRHDLAGGRPPLRRELRARADRAHARRRRTPFQRADARRANRPACPRSALKHVQAMTDDTGMLQHAIFSIPRYEDGYCLDDNARALLLMALLEDAGGDDPAVVRGLGLRYLAFVSHAFDRSTGRFRNFLSYARHWLEPCGSEDSQGEPCGRSARSSGGRRSRPPEPRRRSVPCRPASGDGLHEPAGLGLRAPRHRRVLRAFQGDSTVEARRRQELADRLLGLFQRTSRPDWPWFEDSVTYCNGALSQALIVSGDRMHRPDMVDAGMRSLDWLMSVQSSPDKQFAPSDPTDSMSGGVAGDVRPAAGRGLRDGVGVPRRVPRQRRQAVADPGAVGVQLVPR